MSNKTNNNLKFNQERNNFEKRTRTEEMRMQVTTFAIMIFLTLIAFAMVAAGLSKEFVIPAVLLMALIQVILQFYYFMHMKHPGHGTAKLMMLSGLFIAGTFVITAIYITWLGEPLLK
ncbi:cytochrome C oxidase subunit IV family protein [Macrococcoides bohemicum]|uniref:Cytochrome B6 n=1 Tax=Macrococcoides bohemicum TaxID=1903056 RepID=A0A328A4C4_9STAP|nr:cytochrome C oxidase subunit IV family protein [Macrococcus bohemicus]RAK49156.1 cytochrome B6 [Macrococcus bohemicus]